MSPRNNPLFICVASLACLMACSGNQAALPVAQTSGAAGVLGAFSSASREKTAASATYVESLAINAGGTAVGSNWIADADYKMAGYSGVASVTNIINTSNITNPAPASVYRTQRWATTLTYVIPKLAPGAAYSVRLDFVESYWNGAGKRIFDASINGVQVLSNFDIFNSAGGANIAIGETFAAAAATSGKITIKLAASVNNASIAGIEIAAITSASPSPTPSPASRPTAQPGYGPRAAVGPQASITCSPNSVNLLPGQDIETIVSTHSAGTAYCLSPGTYAQQTITPHSGDTFIGLQGAILDGQNISQYVFSNYYAGSAVANVTIENLVIRNYNSPVQTGAVFGDGSANTGWTVLNNEIAGGGAIGVYAQGGWKIVANYIHNNAQGGYFASGTGIAITDNEIASNDPNNAFDFNVNGCGGGKTYASSSVNVSYNYSHDNVGPGLWTDTDNQAIIYRYNDLENNSRNGIMHEISWDAVIQNNFLRGDGNSTYCGTGTGGNIYCPEIFISNSGGEPGQTVDVSANTIVAGGYGAGIGLLNVSRGSGLYGPWLVQNVSVHNNLVSLAVNLASPGGTFGAVDHDGSDPAMFTSQGNTFDSDSFTGAVSNSFYWGPGNIYGVSTDFAGFQADGQEIHGTSH